MKTDISLPPRDRDPLEQLAADIEQFAVCIQDGAHTTKPFYGKLLFSRSGKEGDADVRRLYEDYIPGDRAIIIFGIIKDDFKPDRLDDIVSLLKMWGAEDCTWERSTLVNIDVAVVDVTGLIASPEPLLELLHERTTQQNDSITRRKWLQGICSAGAIAVMAGTMLDSMQYYSPENMRKRITKGKDSQKPSERYMVPTIGIPCLVATAAIQSIPLDIEDTEFRQDELESQEPFSQNCLEQLQKYYPLIVQHTAQTHAQRRSWLR